MAEDQRQSDREAEAKRIRQLTAIRLHMAEASPDAMIVITREGLITDANQEAELLFAMDREDMFGNPVECLMPEEFRDRHNGHVERFFLMPRRREMGAGMELWALRKDGERVKVNIHLAPFVIPGDDGGLFGLAVIRRVA